MKVLEIINEWCEKSGKQINMDSDVARLGLSKYIENNIHKIHQTVDIEFCDEGDVNFNFDNHRDLTFQ